jgi:hypothetical protein
MGDQKAGPQQALRFGQISREPSPQRLEIRDGDRACAHLACEPETISKADRCDTNRLWVGSFHSWSISALPTSGW